MKQLPVLLLVRAAGYGGLAVDVDGYVRDSYRYLRLALVVATVSLAISIAIEILYARCFQGSISAFYYTPVHSIFVGVLFVIGVALIALRGRDTVEDMLFNLAGFLAPTVALVPTSRPSDLCGPADRLMTVPNSALISNNVVALLAASALALVVATFLAHLRGERKGSYRESFDTSARSLSKAMRVGLMLSALVIVAGAVWYWGDNDSFSRRAHGTAAALMFVAIWLAVLVNADFKQPRRTLLWVYHALGSEPPDYSNSPRHASFYRPKYRLLAVLMFVAGVLGAIAVNRGVEDSVFWLEVTEIVAFTVFWALQTGEGWKSGPTASPRRSSTAPGDAGHPGSGSAR